MSKETRFKAALGELDPNVRTAILYVESMVHEKHREALSAQANKPQKVDFSKIESKLDSLQKQIDGLRPKVEISLDLVKEHDGREQYLEKLTKKADEMFDNMKKHFEELYKSGYFREGIKREIRDEGLIDTKRERE